MKRLTILSAITIGIFSLSSCTLFLLEEVEGGHSPMMMLNGTWDIDNYTTTENGKAVDVTEVGGVWFNTTRDVGGYCEGDWLEARPTVTKDFLWGIDGDGEGFRIQDDKGQDVEWEVLHLSKNKFQIQRTERGIGYNKGITYNIDFSR